MISPLTALLNLTAKVSPLQIRIKVSVILGVGLTVTFTSKLSLTQPPEEADAATTLYSAVFGKLTELCNVPLIVSNKTTLSTVPVISG